MKAFIHLGMHKTGTSSIQESYARHAPDGFFYPNAGGANLNVDARLLFEEDAQCAHLPMVAREGAGALPGLRQRARDRLLGAIEASGASQVILSAERFTYMSPEAVERMRDFLTAHFDALAFYAYIRDPLSFVKSSFQQRVKTGARGLNFKHDYPAYRRRFEKFETIFGTGALQYRLFRRDLLREGNVVLDFADWIGGSYDARHVMRVNEGISVEALALLMVHRQYGSSAPLHKGVWPGPELTALLDGFGSGTWHLGEEACARILAEIEEDCAWMQARLDRPLKRGQHEEGHPVNGPACLETIATQAFADLRPALAEAMVARQARRLPELAAKIDFLRQIS